MKEHDVPRAPVRRQYHIESIGYPLTAHLVIHVTVTESQAITIRAIEVFAQEEHQTLLATCDIDDFPLEVQADITHALHGAVCAETDRAAFSRMVDNVQAALR